MQYKTVCNSETEVVDALRKLRPAVVITFETVRPIPKKVAFGISEDVLHALNGIIPVSDEIHGLFMAYETDWFDSKMEYGKTFCLAIRAKNEPSYFNLDGVETFKVAIDRAARQSTLGEHISKATWHVVHGSTFVFELAEAVNCKGSEYELHSNRYDYQLCLFPVNAQHIDQGDSGEIAAFLGVYPRNTQSDRNELLALLDSTQSSSEPEDDSESDPFEQLRAHVVRLRQIHSKPVSA